jgi:2-methylaconitate cis-trans-isomerase PrpF
MSVRANIHLSSGAISIASAIPGTLVNTAAGGGERDRVTFGHPSGNLKVGGKRA